MGLGEFSLKDACALVQLVPEKKLFGDFFNVDDSSDQVVRLSKKQDATCIYIRHSESAE